VNLAHTRRIYQDLADRAEKENWSYRDFLALLLAEESGASQAKRACSALPARLISPSSRPLTSSTLVCKRRCGSLCSAPTWGWSSSPRALADSLRQNGSRKNHLAVAIGYRAIQNGFETFCTTAAELVEDLSNASKKGRLQESLLTYTHPHVLLVDEVGYLTYGPDAANVLFHVVNDRHLRKRPMIFTTISAQRVGKGFA